MTVQSLPLILHKTFFFPSAFTLALLTHFANLFLPLLSQVDLLKIHKISSSRQYSLELCHILYIKIFLSEKENIVLNYMHVGKTPLLFIAYFFLFIA